MDAPQPSTSGTSAQSSDEPPVKRRLYSEEFAKLWNIVKISKELGTQAQFLAFAEDRELLPRGKLWPVHRTPMKIDATKTKVGSFRCFKGKCAQRPRVSRAAGTWFENVKISLEHIFYLMYCFAHRMTYDDVIREDFSKTDNHCLSPVTICDWYSCCREIGGPGKVVQIDESKFGKRKYNKGRHIEGHWVLGLIEDGSEDLRLEVCPDNMRSTEVLIPLIKKHVAEGTTIHTDYWKAYDCLGEHGYIHKKVNHGDPDSPFIADDGTHTQRIESQWRAVKRFFRKENYNNAQNFADIIVEYYGEGR